MIALGCGDSRPRADASRPTATAAAPGDGGAREAEIALLESLSIAALPPLPAPASNRVAETPLAAELGHRLFFDPGLSRDGSVSCASCHIAELLFTDGRASSRGLGDTSRNAPTLVGAAHSPWQFWDGRRDSLWAQALAPMEAAVEMGSTRVAVVRHVSRSPQLAALYERVFDAPPLPGDPARFPARAGPFGDRAEQDAWYRMPLADRRAVDVAFANVGKAIEAYERLLAPGPARFDRFVAGLRDPGADANGAKGAKGAKGANDAMLTKQEIAGLRLFIDPGRTLCLRCHNGPLFTNQSFHDVGTGAGEGPLPDFGRYLGLQAVLIDPFNCLGAYSDALQGDCKELRFLDKRHAEAEMGKFKTPTLRGLARTAPYMHDGRHATLQEVVDHYRFPPVGPDALEITPLAIDDEEAAALVAFLLTLDGGIAADAAWLRPPEPPAAFDRGR